MASISSVAPARGRSKRRASWLLGKSTHSRLRHWIIEPGFTSTQSVHPSKDTQGLQIMASGSRICTKKTRPAWLFGSALALEFHLSCKRLLRTASRFGEQRPLLFLTFRRPSIMLPPPTVLPGVAHSPVGANSTRQNVRSRVRRFTGTSGTPQTPAARACCADTPGKPGPGLPSLWPALNRGGTFRDPVRQSGIRQSRRVCPAC